ncbi:MAG: bifunctional phosphoglucose/phosphomannose isomerase [Thermotogae bacterium]|nr:bifunctional phosphoglucose/phosphomannose isomerase [Thermotogota bacterium]
MIDNIRKFPEMLRYSPSWRGDFPGYEGGRIAVIGMGGSAAAGDLFADWTGMDVRTVRHYNLPPFYGKGDFFVAISYSGNTEETLSAYGEAIERGMRGFVITTGGKLGAMAERDGVPVVEVPSGYQPREAFGYLFRALVFGAHRSGIIDDALHELSLKAAENLDAYASELDGMDSPTYEVATMLYRRLPLIYADAKIGSVATRWKNQINENANAFAHVSLFPEHNHNEIEGFDHPEFLETKAWLLFLKTDYDHPRVRLRMEVVEDLLRDYVMGAESVVARGESLLEQMLYLIWFGDFVSYWLTVEYGGDPYRIDRIRNLKEILAKR